MTIVSTETALYAAQILANAICDLCEAPNAIITPEYIQRIFAKYRRQICDEAGIDFAENDNAVPTNPTKEPNHEL